MAIWHCLVTIQPLKLADGTRYTVRASSANDRAICGLGGVVWEPCLTQAPSLALSLFNGDFGNAIEPGSARLPLNMDTLKKGYPLADECDWSGAPVAIYIGRSGDAWPWTQIFAGRVSDYARQAQTLALAAEVDSEPFDADQLPATYAGTGGAEGGADLKNKVKPLVIGWAMNVEPVLIDAVNNVYQFHGYGAIEAVTALYERGSDFGASVGDFASYAALVAATIPPGRWGTCLAAGMVRLGAPAYGVITGDVKGHKVGSTTPRLTGAIIQALATIAGVNAALLETATLTALDTAFPYSANLVLTDQTSFADTARGLALPLNAQAGVSLMGTFFAAKVDLSASPALTLDAQGKALPQVADATESKTSPPYARMIFGANRSWRVHSYDEIATYAALVDRGAYSSSETYREGNIAQDQGSSWLYVNPAPTSGNAPPSLPTTSNAYWQVMAKAGNDGSDGTNGTDAVLVTLTANGSSFQYDGAGALIARTIMFTAQTQNGSGSPVTFQVHDSNDSLLGDGTAAVWGGSGFFTFVDDHTLSMSHTQYASFISGHPERESFTLSATYDGIVDKVPVNAVRDGTDGLPGTNGTDGSTFYTWVAYANAPDGTVDFTNGAPGGRAFIGIASNKTTATESANPADYLWSQYKGPPTFGLIGSVGVALAGNAVIKTSTVTDWDEQAYSSEGYRGGAFFSCKIPAGVHAMAGLNSDPTTNASYTSIDFAYFGTLSDLQIFEGGAFAGTILSGTRTGNETLSGYYDGKQMRYYVDGTLVHTTSAPADLTLYFDSSLYDGSTACRITDIAFGPAGPAGADGTSPILATLSVLNRTIQANSSNVTKAGQVPFTSTLKVTQGTTDITGSCAATVTPSNTTDINASYSGGVVSVTKADASGYVDAAITYGGNAVGTLRINIARQQDAPPPASQASASTDITNDVIGSTLASYGPTILLKANASGQLIATAGGEYTANATGGGGTSTFRMAGAIGYRIPGGAWSYTAETVSGSTASTLNSTGDATPAPLNISQTISGLSAGVVYEVTLGLRQYSGTATSGHYGGSMTVNQ